MIWHLLTAVDSSTGTSPTVIILITLLAALLAGGGTMLAAWWARGQGRADRKVAQAQVNLNIFVESLRVAKEELAEAEGKVAHLTLTLDDERATSKRIIAEARADAERWREESRIAMANQTRLANFIHRRIPDETAIFQQLESINNGR